MLKSENKMILSLFIFFALLGIFYLKINLQDNLHATENIDEGALGEDDPAERQDANFFLQLLAVSDN